MIPTIDDASLPREWYWYGMADGNSRWTLSLHRLFTLLGAAYTQRWRNPPADAGLRMLSTTDIRGGIEGVFLGWRSSGVLSCP
jgi:hypothetical protein